jgi:EmrB/QacA subfamily drug resistance transporter
MTVTAMGTSDRQRRLLVLAVCSMSLLLVGLDATIVNVALPQMQRSLHSSVAGLQWTVDAYTLVIASLLMLAGSTADRVGRRRVFQLGLVVFSLGSLVCALAPGLGVLVAARVLQAVGASMLSPVAMSIVRTTFVDPAERARAIGVYAATFGLSVALGPVLGGALVEAFSWRAVFLINVPIGALAVLLTHRLVPESRAASPRRVDPVGQVLVIVGFGTLIAGIIEGPGHGWRSPGIVALLAAAGLAIAALVPYELRRREPLIEMRFFRSVPFSGAGGIAVCACAAFGAFLFLSTLYLQDVRELSPLGAGLAMLPMAGMVLACAPLSGRLVAARGPRPSLLAAGTALIAAVATMTRLAPDTPLVEVLAAYALFGLGFGFVNPPITNAAVSGMPAAQAGVAAAVASTSRQVGLTLGVAIVGGIAGGGAALGRSAESFTAAAGPVWWAILGLVTVVLLLGWLCTTRWAEGTARRASPDPERRKPAAASSGGTGSIGLHGVRTPSGSGRRP